MDDLRWRFAELVEHLSLPPAASWSAGGHWPPSSRARPRQQENILQQQAAQGTFSAQLETIAPDSSTVRIDYRAPVPLTPSLAHLLQVLMADDGSKSDHLVPWKDGDDVSAAMTKLTGKKYTRHALSQLISRLKRALSWYGENPFLVQSDLKLGYRFAQRRQSRPVTMHTNR